MVLWRSAPATNVSTPELGEQAYKVVPTKKACLTDPDSLYCTLLREANSSRVMQSWKAAKLYDAYHQRGDAGGLHNRMGVFEPRVEQVRIANYVQKQYPVVRYPSVLEGGPGSCWVLRTLQAANYSVQGQELSRHAIVHNCKGLDVKHGFLKSLHFRSASVDIFVSTDVIEHIPLPDVLPTLQEIRRVVRPSAYFIFSVGVCAKLCGGYCSSPAIHPTGICDDFPRAWWNRQLADAGFELAPHREMRQLEETVLNRKKPPECPRDVGGEGLMWCRTSWNPPAHNYFLARTTGVASSKPGSAEQVVIRT